MNEVPSTIQRRRSIRHFGEEQIKPEELDAIIGAGLAAPSATNAQDRHLSVIQNRAVLDRINGWVEEEVERSGIIDAAATTENILIAAESLDIGSCWIGMVAILGTSAKLDSYARELEIPDEYVPHMAITLGYKTQAAPAAPERKPNLVSYIL